MGYSSNSIGGSNYNIFSCENPSSFMSTTSSMSSVSSSSSQSSTTWPTTIPQIQTNNNNNNALPHYTDLTNNNKHYDFVGTNELENHHKDDV